ncbi:MAG: 4Fe-4S ferredoxin, partial [Desulfobulbaceae bacterium]|nr:4Fe-4S ferredoxin [Desulfobulbaceae bacterium]
MDDELKGAIRKVLPDVDCVIGWGPGPDPLRSAPFFMRKPEEVDAFAAGPLAVNNPAVFLPEYKGKKVGIVVKGCDSRSVVQQIAEGLVKREEVVIIGFPCSGVVDIQ